MMAIAANCEPTSGSASAVIARTSRHHARTAGGRADRAVTTVLSERSLDIARLWLSPAADRNRRRRGPVYYRPLLRAATRELRPR
ncbi:MAG: hypothetical protein ACREIB_07590, partial [Pseudomonadota bacterium]